MSGNNHKVHQLPNCLTGIPVSSNMYSGFWRLMTSGAVVPVEYREGGLQMGMLFESYLFCCARSMTNQYKPAPWKYVYCNRGRQLFYMYPEWDFNIKPADMIFSDLTLSAEAFGFYITLYALSEYRHVAPEKHWVHIYDTLSMWARNQITDARMLELKCGDTPESTAELAHLENALKIIENISR